VRRAAAPPLPRPCNNNRCYYMDIELGNRNSGHSHRLWLPIMMYVYVDISHSFSHHSTDLFLSLFLPIVVFHCPFPIHLNGFFVWSAANAFIPIYYFFVFDIHFIPFLLPSIPLPFVVPTRLSLCLTTTTTHNILQARPIGASACTHVPFTPFGYRPI